MIVLENDETMKRWKGRWRYTNICLFTSQSLQRQHSLTVTVCKEHRLQSGFHVALASPTRYVPIVIQMPDSFHFKIWKVFHSRLLNDEKINVWNDWLIVIDFNLTWTRLIIIFFTLHHVAHFCVSLLFLFFIFLFFPIQWAIICDMQNAAKVMTDCLYRKGECIESIYRHGREVATRSLQVSK